MIKPRSVLIVIAVLLIFGLVPLASARPDGRKGAAVKEQNRLHIISSSHQDIAWMDSPEKCIIYRDTNCITPALAMMAKDPAYSFTMENMLNLAEYLERHPDRSEEIARLTREGRMEWGATYNQPYESLLSGEQLIREAYFGRLWLKRTFPGADATVYFNPDVPGRAAQMPQILAKAGIPYLVMSRYHEGFYRWASPDGSSVLAYSPGHYGNAAAYLNAAPAEGAKAIAGKVAKWKEYYASRGLPAEYPLLNSVDFSQPTDFRPLIRYWNEGGTGTNEARPVMQYSTARKFFEALDVKTAKLDTVTGERPGLWLYIHGPTHHWAITAAREAARLLPAAEAFSTVRALLEGSFASYPAKRLEAAWAAEIYPDHGWGGKEGQITDRLFRKKYEFARDEGRAMRDEALGAIAGRIAVDPAKGIPIVIFNSLSWPQTGPVQAVVPSWDPAYHVLDAEGRPAPMQVPPLKPSGTYLDVSQGRYIYPGRPFEFVATDVPALGYKVYYLRKAEPPTGPVTGGVTGGPPKLMTVETDFYRISLALGGVAGIFDKELGREILDTRKFNGFEVFTMRSVGNGAGEFGRVQQPTMEGFDKASRHAPSWRLLTEESGPIKWVYAFEQPFAGCIVREKLIVYNSIKRIDCEVSLLGWDGDPYREFRLALPVAAEKGQVAYEIPLGVLEVGSGEAKGTGGPAYGNLVYDEELKDIRPREVQNFLYAGDDDFGLTLTTSVAVNDYKDPTDDPVAYPALQPILLASRRSCHGEGNWYLQEGDHHYRFSLTSHAAGWRNGYRAGIAPNDPLVAVVAPTPASRADLPESKSFLPFSAPNLVLSTMKKAETDDAVILRFYDIEGKDAEAAIELFAPVRTALRTNIIEEEGPVLKPRQGKFPVPVGHNAVETVKLVPDSKKR
ncbi:MAG TPA: glycosyl hydrolase-related protein [Acidobacteriota bacterium]|nr:glycosyl hydrolase-related protein [Acidobacteriota bacterium]